MRKIQSLLLVVVCLVSMTTAAFGAKKTAPESLKLSVMKKFPQAENLVWEEDGKFYMVSFDHADVQKYVRIDATGNFHEIGFYSDDEMSAKVTAAIDAAYPEGYVESVFKTEMPNKVYGYMVIVDNGDSRQEVVYNLEGKKLRDRKLPKLDIEDENGGSDEGSDDWK